MNVENCCSEPVTGRRLAIRFRAMVVLAVLIGLSCPSHGQDDRARERPEAKPRRSGKTLKDRYPLPYPPTLADGRTAVTEQSPLFLEPGANLREDVQIAATAPVVDFAFYPEQNYPGNPWSHRADGIVVGDKYYSSSNDHLAPRGTALLWEYGATAKQFRLLCDTSRFLESVNAFPESMNYRPGEMQSRIDLGSDGWLYYATDRGSPTATHDGNGWLGEWILRTHPQTAQTEIVYTHPIARHTIPASVLDPQRMILYCGTAPGKDAANQSVQFFALDVKNKKILKVDNDGPTRTLIFSKSTGRVFWQGKMYDPATNEITPANVPHVRSATQETPQGIVYGTSERSADLWALNVKSGEVSQLGNIGVGSQQYIASIDADPTGRYLYYVPGAHGGASKDGTPVVQYDTQTRTRKVIAFLHKLFWDKHGYALDGCFGSALDEKGERLFISWDGWRKGQPRGWESTSMTVLHIPATERQAAEPPAASTQTSSLLHIDGPKLYEQAVTSDVVLAENHSVTLQQGVLVEDDGPAAGYSYQPNEELLDERTWIKKELIVERPKAKQATLLVGRSPGRNPQPLSARINGRVVELEPAGKTGANWEQYRFDPAVLVAGRNEIVLHGTGKVWIARDDEFAAGSRTRTRHPNRSAKSSDAGQTWDYDHLGPKGDIDGEYYVRLFLDQYQPQGSLTLPVVDVVNLDGQAIGSAVSALGPLRISLDEQTNPHSSVTIRYRTGTSPVPTSAGWSAWTVMSETSGTIAQPQGRYLQIKVELTSQDGLATPQVKSLEIAAEVAKTADWSRTVRQVEADNPPLVRSSIPFEYEPFDRAELKALREKYNLDEVTKDCSTEFELMTTLARWSSGLWTKMHLAESYPEWNALKILAKHPDGQPVGGFCQHYNLVFLQACESYGLVGRPLSLGQGQFGEKLIRSGHEVVEIWSNEFKKWIYIDGNCAWYFIDEATGTPLSLLELRERQLATVRGEESAAVRVVRLADTKWTWQDLTDWPAFVELRLIPRSNFLAEKSPLPLNQGMRGWFWTGHYVWSDEQAPASPIYSQRVEKGNNFEWSINRAEIKLEATEMRGELRVHLDTETPELARFAAQIDDEPPRTVSSGFTWKLHPGKNRLEVRPVNTQGREGVSSHVVLDASEL